MRGLKTVVGIFLQTSGQHMLERGRRSRIDGADRFRVFFQNRDASESGSYHQRAVPRSISYSTAPNAKKSERASASLPSICSGDMYWIVPIIVPAVVSGETGLGLAQGPAAGKRRRRADPSAAAGTPRISPGRKSISFAPAFVSMMFPGFRSRCTMPLAVRDRKCFGYGIPIFKISFSGKGPFASLSARVSPSRNSMTR